jgi:ABC-type spermidine/putrescine transport system permease subunit II
LISVATTEVFAGLQKLDRAQEEASLDLGANYWQTFWRITVPNLETADYRRSAADLHASQWTRSPSVSS